MGAARRVARARGAEVAPRRQPNLSRSADMRVRARCLDGRALRAGPRACSSLSSTSWQSATSCTASSCGQARRLASTKASARSNEGCDKTEA